MTPPARPWLSAGGEWVEKSTMRGERRSRLAASSCDKVSCRFNRRSAMASQKNKTTQTEASVEAYFAAIPDPARRADCEALAAMMQEGGGRAGEDVGAGHRRLRQLPLHVRERARGRHVQARLLIAQGRDRPVYRSWRVHGSSTPIEVLEKLGKHKTGKGCLYIRKLDDVDAKVLQRSCVEIATRRRARRPSLIQSYRSGLAGFRAGRPPPRGALRSPGC